MSLWRLGGKAVNPWLEQSAVILPDIHRHRQRAGQEERKSHLDRRLNPEHLLSPDCRLEEEQEEDVGDEGVAAPHRHPDSDSLTQNCVTFVQPAGCSPRDGPSATTGESRWH